MTDTTDPDGAGDLAAALAIPTISDPAIAAQQLDARLARQQKALGDLGHIALQTRIQAEQDVQRIMLIRRRLRAVFGDELPDLDDHGPGGE